MTELYPSVIPGLPRHSASKTRVNELTARVPE
jgi:hypothetical protein